MATLHCIGLSRGKLRPDTMTRFFTVHFFHQISNDRSIWSHCKESVRGKRHRPVFVSLWFHTKCFLLSTSARQMELRLPSMSIGFYSILHPKLSKYFLCGLSLAISAKTDLSAISTNPMPTAIGKKLCDANTPIPNTVHYLFSNDSVSHFFHFPSYTRTSFSSFFHVS